MGSHRRGLGRGLGALIPTSAPPSDRDSPMSTFLLRGSDDAATDGGGSNRPTLTAVGTRPATENDMDGSDRSVGTIDPGGIVDTTGIGYYAELPIDQVVPNEHQPRQVFDQDALDELVASIQQVGLLQ